MKIRIQKGHNIRISGSPVGSVQDGQKPSEVGIVPADFRGIKPKLVVKTGDSVKLGSALFFDKNSPKVNYPSPGAGTIKDVVYGERRSIRKIIIRLAEKEIAETQDPISIENSSRDDLIAFILKANLWPLILQRPFGKAANPEVTPKAIFVSVTDTAPLAIDPILALEEHAEAFKTGLSVLTRLTGEAVHVSTSQFIPDLLQDLPGITVHQFSGPHPAGNVGIQVHHIDPINPGDVVWTVAPQQVATLGKLFLTGQYDPGVVIAVGGPAIAKPGFLQTRVGAPISQLTENNVSDPDSRLISGNVLTGRLAEEVDFLGFYHSAISGLVVDKKRPFLGWARVGSSRKNYTLTNAYLKTGKPDFEFSTKINGGHRALVPLNAWEDMLPMDIIPIALYRSILANDVEEMEKLGIMECDPEDFALAAFACPSKTELLTVIRQGLEIMEKEV